MKTEGVYTYFCSKCELLFAVVARFSVKGDLLGNPSCPKCEGKAINVGEGYIKHENYVEDEMKETAISYKKDGAAESEYPIILNVSHVAKILGVSKRVAYEIMEQNGFPLVRFNRSKRANREDFFQWLKNH